MDTNDYIFERVIANKEYQSILSEIESVGEILGSEIQATNQLETLSRLRDWDLTHTNLSDAGGTKRRSILSGKHRLTSFGRFVLNTIKRIREFDKHAVRVTISKGDFKQFIVSLETFLNSNDSDKVKSAYEFVFENNDSSDFYDRSRNRMFELRDNTYDLNIQLAEVTTAASHQQAYAKLEESIDEFLTTVEEVEETIIQLDPHIEELLSDLTNKSDSFYQERAELIEGPSVKPQSGSNLRNTIDNFVQKVNRDGISNIFIDTYSDIADRLSTLHNNMIEVRNNLNARKRLNEIAEAFESFDSVEDCQRLYEQVFGPKVSYEFITIRNTEDVRMPVAIDGDRIVITAPNIDVTSKEFQEIDDIEFELGTLNYEKSILQEELDKLTMYKKFIDDGLRSKTYTNEEYAELKNMIVAGFSGKRLSTKNHTQAPMIILTHKPSSEITISTKLSDGRTASFVVKDHTCEVEQKNGINQTIEKLIERVAEIDANIIELRQNTTI